jgi:hypothetical protein
MADNVEFIDQKVEQKENRSGSLKDVLSGALLTSSFVLKQLPYIIFLTVLALLYIGNRYNAEKVARETMELTREVKELRAEATSLSSELMLMNRLSQVEKLVQLNELELKQPVKPPRKIIIKKEQ